METQQQFIPNDKTPANYLSTVESAFPQSAINLTMLEIDTAAELYEEQHSLARLLAVEEQAKYATYSLVKRKNEWLAGRMCAKTAVIKQLSATMPIAYSEIIIANHNSGRPYVKLAQSSNRQHSMDISISHSHNYAIGVCADWLCGVDIQKYNDSLFRIQERFCSPDESLLLGERLASFKEKDTLNLLWTAKEAVRKTMSHFELPGFQEIVLQSIAPSSHRPYISFTFALHTRIIRVISGLCGDYALSTCLFKD